ncbi:MAG: CotH kinase family protein [Paludibacteraceae bacterium]|nr:CotH kinase family protein [Paludibacteraceae bacterium]
MGKKLKAYTLALFALMSSSSAYSDVIINEVMPCNIATYFNKEHDLTGWVELYNDGSKDINLKGWTFTNYNLKATTSTEKVKWSWTVNQDITIAAGKYKVIPFDAYQPEEKYTPKEEIHAPYKVDADGGSLELSDGKSYEYTLKYPKMKPHFSYGTDEEGVNGYMVPTPKEANTTAFKTLSDQCATPTFGDVKPGVFPNSTKESGKKITLSSATSGVTIRYTLDGTIPTEKSNVLKADSAIKLNETRVIRARAYKSGKLPSDVLTGSFIIYSSSRNDCSGEDPAVVSIVTNDDFFHSNEYGMCVVGNESTGMPISGPKTCIIDKANYNRDWQRGINFEYFEKGDQKICQEALAGVMGGCSRKTSYTIKSLKINTNKRTGKETFDYKVFKNESTKKDNIYSSFQLRNGGNGYEELLCRDGFIQNIAKGIGNIDYQAYIPVSYYYNGKYKGMMGLRERTNASYVKSNYGLDEDKIDIVEFSEQKIEAGCGDLNAYNEMYEFVTDSANYKKENFVSLLDNYMDVEEYVNYMILEQFIVNTDWPGNNQKAWRKHVGGKFRWILYDTDFGLGRFEGWGPNYTNKSLNTVKWCTGESSESNWATQEYEWKTKFFRCLMKNQGFRNIFLTQALILLDGPLSPSAIDKVYEEFLPTVEKEHCLNKNVEDRGDDRSKIDATHLKHCVSFAKERNSIYKNDLAEYCKLDVSKKTNLKLVSRGDDKDEVTGFRVNYATIMGNRDTIDMLTGMNLKIRPIISEGYIVRKWIVYTTEDTVEYKSTQTLDVKMSGKSVKVEAYIVEDSYDKPSIVINELCAKSSNFIEPDSQEPSDWIELYNTSEKEYVDVAGFYLSDNDTTVQIAKGYEITNIPPKGHLVLWADGRGKSGARHLDFKLTSTGETITLTKKVKDSIILVDKIKMPSQENDDYSYGRSKDGATTFATFASCENTEFSEATPGEENGKYKCETIIDSLTYKVSLACDFDRAQYNVNGKVIGPNKVSTYIRKGKSLTVSPVLPKKAYFVKWQLSTPIESYDSIIHHMDEWRYHYADSQPSGDWTALKYNETGWKTGKGYMGFDEGNKDRGFQYTTPFAYNKKGGDEGDSVKFITGYFRHKFTLVDTSEVLSISAKLIFDDGAAVYLNGKEIKRFNLDEGKLTYETPTPTHNDDEVESFSLNFKDLKIGENIIAVEVHQKDRASSDFTFALSAKAKYLSKTTKEEKFTITPKGAISATLFIEDYTGENNTSNEARTLTFYPNPTESVIYLSECDEEMRVTVYDQRGNMLLIQFVESADEAIDLSKLPQGIYYVHATSKSGDAIGKVIKQ